MVEFAPITVTSIVASLAIAAKILGVTLHENELDLGMAGIARCLVETGVDLRVTIITTKGCSIGLGLVAVQKKAKRSVREVGITEVDQR
jgi:hypothetical protein